MAGSMCSQICLSTVARNASEGGCTDQSSYGTGAELHINGGQHV